MADTNAYRPQRPRTSSMLSWGSHKSKDSQPKIDLTETEKDKAQRRIKGKADPSVAIRELQPSAQAFEKSTIASLRSMQFRDANGEVITDPDRSNPTRPRFERPLDTIRSFEAAIDSSYSSRYPTANTDLQSRRNSMFSGYAPQSRNPTKTFSTYYDRQPDSRPESIYEQQQANGYANYSGGAQPNAWNGARRMPHGRMTSEPAFNIQAQSRQHAYQNSYDTTTASSAGTYQTDQGTVSTNPSSFNGSYGDAGYTHPHMKPQPPIPQETYGIEFGSQQEDEYATQLNNSAYYQQSSNNHATNNLPARGSSYGNAGDATSPPPPPPHSNSTRKTLRKPVGGGGGEARPAPASNGYNSYDGYSANNGYNGYNGQSNGYNGHNGHNGYNGYDAESPSVRPKNEKRKSWLSRRFSRQT